MDRIQVIAIAAAALLLAASFLLRPAAPPGPAPSEPRAEARAPGAEPEREEPLPPRIEATEPEHPPDEVPDAVRHEDVTLATLTNDAVQVDVSALGGRVRSIRLLGYRDRVGEDAGPVELVTAPERGTLALFLGPGLEGIERAPVEAVQRSSRAVETRAAAGGVQVSRTLELDEKGYGATLRVALHNGGDREVRPELQLAWYGRERPSDAPDYLPAQSLLAVVAGDVKRRPLAGIDSAGFIARLLGRTSPQTDAYGGEVEALGVDSQYFLSVAIPEDPDRSIAFHEPIARDTGRAVLAYPAFAFPPGKSVERRYRLYLGPKVRDEVRAVDARLDGAIRVGWSWVRPLVDLFASMLAWLHDHVVANYGVAIILLTVLLRLVTFPLTQRSMKSMRRFSTEIAPRLKEIQERYKDDKERMQREMMSLYRQRGMNPFVAMGGGCVPMLIQMPFLVALFFALQSSIELRHADFVLWINDLSVPETLVRVAGLPIRVLPLLMGASMLLQQRLTPQTSVDPQQRQMMTWMSVLFTFMFYQFPSGLVLYWFVSNLLGIAQQMLVNRSSPQPAAT